MLIGSDCSVSTEPIAQISHHWNLVQVSYIECVLDWAACNDKCYGIVDISVKFIAASFKH